MTPKMLIIEDEPLVRRSLERAFKSAGFNVQTATNGLEGIEQWAEFHPQVVLMDVVMPLKTGIEVLRELAPELKQTTQIVLMSALTQEYSPSMAQSLGVHAFIEKPFEDIFKVVEMVRSIV